jgi:hypothetical protein
VETPPPFCWGITSDGLVSPLPLIGNIIDSNDNRRHVHYIEGLRFELKREEERKE